MPNFEHSHALIIGINDYDNGISRLKTAVPDATEIARILKTEHDYTVHLLPNQEANLSQLRQVLEVELPKKIQPGDRFLFYFAGHGIALNGEDGPEGYLVPQDARLGNVSTYLSMSEVNKALLQLPCRHFLGILDCCFAGAFRWSSLRKAIAVELGTLHKEGYERFIQDPAWQVVTSAAYDQSAWDAFDLKDDRGHLGSHSPFACALIEALEGKADAFPPAEPGKPAGDGVMTATDLYVYLRDRVEVATEARAIRQTPGIYPLKKHDKGEYIFLTPRHALNLPPAPPLDTSQNPYRGLLPFEEKHSDLFFGRNALTQKLYEFVTSHSLTVVLGASGSGKSSLVKAGLISKLRQCKDGNPWLILPPFRPGEYPFQALNNLLASVNLPTSATPNEAASSGLLTPARSLANWFKEHPQANLLLVVDQFEELITLCLNDQERQQFLEALAGAIATHPNQLHLILTLRSAFEPQFRNTVLEKNWLAARFIVPAMTREELRQAIEEPASARVMYFDPHELVEQLIDEVANMPGALPLLSFALSELYLKYLKRQDDAKNRRETIDRAITQTDYEDLGGVTRSLTQRADREYEALIEQDSAYAQTIRNVMLRMVAVGGELAQRRVPLSELEYPEPENGRIKTVIKHFEDARLLTFGNDSEGQPYQEPAHEALVRGWQKLLEWKKQELTNVLLQRELTPTANQWASSSNNASFQGLLWNNDPRLPLAMKLLCGSAYKDTWLNFLKWMCGDKFWKSQSNDFWLNSNESKFVTDSFDRKYTRRRNILGITTLVTASLTGLTIIAFIQAQLSGLRERAAVARNMLSTEPLDGLVQVIQVTGQNLLRWPWSILPPVQESLHDAIEVTKEKNRLEGHKDSVNSVAISRDGQLLVGGSSDTTVSLWDFKGNLLERLQHPKNILAVAISADGHLIVSGSSDGKIYFWKKNRGNWKNQSIQGHEGSITSITFNPTGQVIASSGVDGKICLWSLKGKLLTLCFKQLGHINSIAFSPDGRTIVSGGGDGITRLWDLKGNFKILHTDVDVVWAVAFHKDGKFIATGSEDKTIKLLNLQGKTVGHSLILPGAVKALAFSPDGRLLTAGSGDGTGTILTWDLQGNAIGQALHHESGIRSLSYSSDGKTLVSSSQDKTVRLWDTQGNQVALLYQGAPGEIINSVAFAPNSKIIAASSWNGNAGNLNLFKASDFDKINQYVMRQQNIESLIFNTDGTQIVTDGNNGLQLWNLQGKLLGYAQEEMSNRKLHVSASLSSDGTRIANADIDGIRLWQVQDTLSEQSLDQPINFVTRLPFGEAERESSVRVLTFSPDSQTLLSGDEGKEGRVAFWNLQGQLLASCIHPQGVAALAFSPNGQVVASGGWDRTLRLWNPQCRPVRQPLRHSDMVSSLAFSPDGTSIASGTWDGKIYLWDLQGNQVGQPFQHPRFYEYDRSVPTSSKTLSFSTNYINSLAFSPNGKYLVSGSGDGTVRLWRTNWRAWLEAGCDRLKYHPVFRNPQTEEQRDAKSTCQRYVWNR